MPVHSSHSPRTPQSESSHSLLSELHILPPSLSVPPSPRALVHPSTGSLEEPFGTAVRTNGAPNGELDLLPCTLDQYLRLSEYTPAKYELLDNHLFFKRELDDAEAGLIRQSLSYKLRELHADGQAQICVYEVASVHLPGASSSLSPPAARTTSPSSSSINPFAPSASSSVLVPDITVMPYRPRQSPNRCSPLSAAFVASYTKQSPLMHIEITSQVNSRHTDFTTKWVKYAQAGVDEYVIIDRDLPHAPRPGSRASPSWRPCVVVGKRSGPGPFRTTGYPTATVKGAPRRSSRIAAQQTSQLQAGYHWQIFEGNTPIDCTYFRDLGLTPDSLFTIKKVEELMIEDRRQFTLRLERAAEQRAPHNSEEERAAEQRAPHNSEEERAAEQRARRISEERRTAESRAEKAKSSAENAKRREEKAKRELQVLRVKLARALEHNNTRENRKRSRPSSISSDASEERTQRGRENHKSRCPK